VPGAGCRGLRLCRSGASEAITAATLAANRAHAGYHQVPLFDVCFTGRSAIREFSPSASVTCLSRPPASRAQRRMMVVILSADLDHVEFPADAIQESRDWRLDGVVLELALTHRWLSMSM